MTRRIKFSDFAGPAVLVGVRRRPGTPDRRTAAELLGGFSGLLLTAAADGPASVLSRPASENGSRKRMFGSIVLVAEVFEIVY